MTPPTDEVRRPWGFWLALGALLGLVYGPVFAAPPLSWDDPAWLADPLLALGLGDATRAAFGELHDGVYYPLLRLSWWAQAQGVGVSGPVSRAIGLLLVGASAGLARGLLARHLPVRTAELAVLIWLAHPAQVASIAWITSRKELLPAALALGAAALWCRPGPRAELGGLLLIALAGLVKGPAALLGLPALGFAALSSSARWRRLLPAVLALSTGVLALGAWRLARGDSPHAAFTADPLDALGVFGHFAVALVWPPWRSAVPAGVITPLTVAIGVGALGAAALALARRDLLAVGAGLWLAALAPYVGFAAMVVPGDDRHLHLALLGPATLLAARLPRAAWVALPVLALLSAHRARDWRSDDALWAAEATRPGEHWLRSVELGTRAGKAGDFDGAIAHLTTARRLAPDSNVVLARLIVARLARDRWSPEAARIAMALEPPPAGADWLVFARALDALGAAEEARWARDQAAVRRP